MKVSLALGESLIIQRGRLTVHVRPEHIFGNEVIIVDFPVNDAYRIASTEYSELTPEIVSIVAFDGGRARSLEFDNGCRLERITVDESSN